MISKALYDKVACWLADFDDPCLLEESMEGMDWDELNDAPSYTEILLQDAQQILYEVYREYVEHEEKTYHGSKAQVK